MNWIKGQKRNGVSCGLLKTRTRRGVVMIYNDYNDLVCICIL